MRMRNGDMEAHGKSLRRLVSAAYMTAERRVVGGPGWVNEDGFDLILKTEPANTEDFSATVRQVLSEHFGLVTHKESRAVPVYVLKPAQGKPLKLHQAATEGGAGRDQPADDGRLVHRLAETRQGQGESGHAAARLPTSRAAVSAISAGPGTEPASSAVETEIGMSSPATRITGSSR